MDPETLTLQILELIHNIQYSDIVLQNQFTELLGFDSFEFIQDLIQNRQLIMKFTARFMKLDSSHIDEYGKRNNPKGSIIQQHTSSNPYGPSFVVQTESQKRQKKQQIRDSKKMRKKTKPGKKSQNKVNRNDKVIKTKNKQHENYEKTMELLGYKRKNAVDFEKEQMPSNTTTTVHKCM